MALKVDLRHFLDEEGNVLALTAQAKKVFEFLTKIVMSVSENIEKPLIDVDLKCNTRADDLTCDGDIKAKCLSISMIEWHCDFCEASGTVSNWHGSTWDKQVRIIH